MKIKLKEVLWEVTNKCNRNCDFCGSKGILNRVDTSSEQKKDIARSIGEIAEVVTLTGGEPLLLCDTLLEEILSIFKEYDCKVDVVTNGDNLTNSHLKMFRNIGVSVNSIEDAKTALNTIDNILEINSRPENIVFIMNINKLNFFDLEPIISQVAGTGIGFQFQLTMYKDDNPAKINGVEINEVRNKIDLLSNKYGVLYVLADNLQEHHDCQAGIYSCGVLFNGDVVGCLSERSWNNSMNVQGNVLEESLTNIWINEFKKERFDSCKCCRDCLKYVEDTKDDQNTDEKSKDLPTIPSDDLGKVALYGVSTPKQPPYTRRPSRGRDDVMLYGVYPS